MSLKFLLLANILIQFYSEINCLKDCDDVIKKEFSEDGYAIATFRLPSKPDKISITVELSIDPDDFEDWVRCFTICLGKSPTVVF